MLKKQITLSIDEFMEMWQEIKDNNWDNVLPNWDVEMSKIFLDELAERFRQRKSFGSYGDLWNPEVAEVMWAMAARNSEHQMPLNTMGYRESYAKKFPIAWVRSGELRDKISPLVHALTRTKERWGIEIGIPVKTITYTEEPWKDVPPDPMGYLMLEHQRSYIASSLILAWPAMIKKTMELFKK